MRLQGFPVELVQFVRQRVTQPTVHQNGFIQLPLNESGTARLHVWPDGPIVHQATSSPIHDHRFSFRSTVLCGELHHITYEVVLDSNGRHRIALADGILKPTEYRCTAVRIEREVWRERWSYRFAAHLFHETRAVGLTATIMRKEPVAPDAPQARVLIPHDQVPDNDFRRDQGNDPAVLWDYIDRAVLGDVVRV